MNAHDLGLLRSKGVESEQIRSTKSVPPTGSAPVFNPALYQPHLALDRSGSDRKSKSSKLKRKRAEEADWSKRALLAQQQQLAFYSGLISPQNAALQFYAAQAKGLDGLLPPPEYFMNQAQLLEQLEVQRRMAMLSQQQMIAQTQSIGHSLQNSDYKTHTPNNRLVSLKSSVVGTANGGSAFRPVKPKEKLKSDGIKKKLECPPRSSSVPVEKSDQVKGFPFSWDRKTHLSDDSRQIPSLNPLPSNLVKQEINSPCHTINNDSAHSNFSEDLVQAAANQGVLAAWQTHVHKIMSPAKQKLFLRENFNSDSSIPQSPLSCSPGLINVSTPTKTEEKGEEKIVKTTTPSTTEASSDGEIHKLARNETDDEKLKKFSSDVSSDALKMEEKPEVPTEIVLKKTQSPLPLKKRRLHAVVADMLNQSDSFSRVLSRNQSPGVNSSSDSDIPLAIIRDRLQKAKMNQATLTPTVPKKPVVKTENCDKNHKLKMRKEDYITDIESSLKTFKTNVTTPVVTSESESDEPQELKREAPEPPRSRGVKPVRARRRGSNISTSSSCLEPHELQQLAPFIIDQLDSESESGSESESDAEYRSRANFDSDVERRQTRSPGSAKKLAEKIPALKMSVKSTAKKSLESALRNLKKPADVCHEKKRENIEEPLDPALAAFFAAEKEMDEPKGKKLAKTEKIVKIEKTPKIENVIEIPAKMPKKIKSSRKRKSNTPRKLEIVSPQDQWEHSKETVVDKNSSEGKDYIISEADASLESVTCFCGGPFAGRPMIECDKCGIWVHMACGKIKQNNVPENYICPNCRPKSARKTK